MDPEGLLSVGDATAPGCEWWIQRSCCQWEMPQHLVASGGPEGLLSVGDAATLGCEWWIQRGCCQWEMPQHLVASGGPEGLLSVGDATALGCEWWTRGVVVSGRLVASGGSKGVVVNWRCHNTWLRVVDPEGLLSMGDATTPGCEWWIQRGCCQWEMPQHLVASGGSRGVVVNGRCHNTWLRVVDQRGCCQWEMPQHLVASGGPEGLLSVGDLLQVVDPKGLLSIGDATTLGCEWWIQRGCCQWEMPQHLVVSGGSRGVVVSGRCHSTWLRVVGCCQWEMPQHLVASGGPEGLLSVGDATAPGCEWWIQRGCCQWEMPQHLVASGGSRGGWRCHSTWLRVVDPEGLLSVGDTTVPGCEWWIQSGCCQWEMPQHLVASGGSRGGCCQLEMPQCWELLTYSNHIHCHYVILMIEMPCACNKLIEVEQ